MIGGGGLEVVACVHSARMDFSVSVSKAKGSKPSQGDRIGWAGKGGRYRQRRRHKKTMG